MDKLRELYLVYYNSLPTQRWQSKRRHRFKARPLDDLSEVEMMIGANRDYAEQQLEEYFDNCILNKEITWEWGNHWFHQDEEIPSLILLKEWFIK